MTALVKKMDIFPRKFCVADNVHLFREAVSGGCKKKKKKSFFSQISTPCLFSILNVWHPNVGGFFQHQAILQFSVETNWMPYSAIALTLLGLANIPQTKDSEPQDCTHAPTVDANCKSRLLPVALTGWLYIRGSHDSLLGFDKFVRAAYKTQETCLLSTLLVYYRGY